MGTIIVACACRLLIGLGLLLMLAFPCIAQAKHRVEVPSTIRFANMALELSDDARKKIQTDVDALIRYEKYFNAKVERIDAYFPLIEEVLREEKVPEDIKYLVIQESALVGDAVSSSNAVGYWQFKQAAAEEVGLAINKAVDERMNIITATRGAARYFKSNNAYFDNWLYALMAYYEGPGGALKKVDKKQYGAQKMRLKGNTHWYVLKYLSHKIAFEQSVGLNPTPPVRLIAYTDGAGKTLADIAQEFGVKAADLEPYNRWLKQKRVPEDKTYHVIVPRYNSEPIAAPIAQEEKRYVPANRRIPAQKEASQFIDNPTYFAERSDTDEFPIIQEDTFRGRTRTLINGIPGIIARAGEDVSALARRSGISPSQLVRYNDLTSQQAKIEGGKAYYLRAKRNRALAHYHTVAPGESLWSISQRLGIKMKKLMRNNRLKKEASLKPGLVLWTRFIRPESVAITYQEVPSGTSSTPLVAAQSPSPASQTTKATTTRYDEADATFAESGSKSAEIQSWSENTTDRSTATSPSGGLSAEAEESVWTGQALTERRTHTVAPRETLYGIARRYQLSATQLADYNNLRLGDPLKVGQKLNLTADREVTRKPSQQELFMHEVQAGETMFQIARNHGVTIKELMEWNDKSSFDLVVGESLKVFK